MKRGYVYTIVFILIVSAVFTFILAGTDTLLQPRIQENAEIEEAKSILYAFGLDDQGTNEEILQRFEDSTQIVEGSEFDYYENVDESGAVQGIAVPFTGAGLWGTIRGWFAVTPDKSELQGIVFTEQNETPGLGGRITEQWYRDQFRGMPLPEGETVAYGNNNGVQVDAITGATSTSNAIMRIINEVKTEVLPLVEGK